MKRTLFTLLGSFITAAAAAKVVILIFGGAVSGVMPPNSLEMIFFVGFFTVALLIDILMRRTPPLPSLRLERILEKSGYCASFYAVALDWKKKCEKKGCGDAAAVTLAEMLINGGRFKEGFEILGSVDYGRLKRTQKQAFYNAYLYGAVLCSDIKAADEIYAAGKAALFSVKNKALSAAVRHTLGCYEYMHGRLSRAENFFVQAVENAQSCDVMCESLLSLGVCYLDTGRLEAAKNAVGRAAGYAASAPLTEKTERAMRLVEEAFREARGDMEQDLS
ncbi:MAG: hypothetical protein ACI4JW_06900 [Oscillospiraceae bacterium]